MWMIRTRDYSGYDNAFILYPGNIIFTQFNNHLHECTEADLGMTVWMVLQKLKDALEKQSTDIVTVTVTVIVTVDQGGVNFEISVGDVYDAHTKAVVIPVSHATTTPPATASVTATASTAVASSLPTTISPAASSSSPAASTTRPANRARYNDNSNKLSEKTVKKHQMVQRNIDDFIKRSKRTVIDTKTQQTNSSLALTSTPSNQQQTLPIDFSSGPAVIPSVTLVNDSRDDQVCLQEAAFTIRQGF
ncbi:hypothetical protein K492DRAFT_66337 [Lichtheimia hyalospora FSU 10163]|nr:hypothetical protein K492DRAFT_66337 [Lichtheimia hyalospora FSU 10163]